MKKLIMIICMLVAFNVTGSDKKVEEKTVNGTEKTVNGTDKDCSTQELSAQMKSWISDSSHWGKSHRTKNHRANAELVIQIKSWIGNSQFWEDNDE